MPGSCPGSGRSSACAPNLPRSGRGAGFRATSFPSPRKSLPTWDKSAIFPCPTPPPMVCCRSCLAGCAGRNRVSKGWGTKSAFSVSRGPLNIASFLMGTTEFLVALKTDPESMHRLLRAHHGFPHPLARAPARNVSHHCRHHGPRRPRRLHGRNGLPGVRATVSSRLVRNRCASEVLPQRCAVCSRRCRITPIWASTSTIRASRRRLPEMRRLSGGRLTILGNLPPRDVLAKGSPDDVRAAVKRLLEQTPDRSRLILSCAGGMPPGVSTENIRAFCEAAQERILR